MEKVKTFAQFREVGAQSVSPEGFLLESLRRQRSGLTGNYKEQGYPFDTVMWAGMIRDVGFRDMEYNGRRLPVAPINAWWPYEQSGYLLDGVCRLGLLLNDPEMRNIFETNLKYLLDHPNPDGKLGGKAAYDHDSEWPMAVFFKAVIAYVEATGDEKVIEAFHRHYQALNVEELALPFRHILNLEGLLRVYFWTGDEELKKKAVEAYKLHNKANRVKERYEDELWFDKIASDKRLVMHGVSSSEALKLPVLLYIATGEAKYLKAAQTCLNRIFIDHEQPSGMPSANEYLSGHDPLQGYETCVITDLTWTMGYFLLADGDARISDKIEQIMYNAFEGSITKDFASLQYLSGVNQVLATPFSNNSHFLRGRSAWRQYRPNHFPECCPGNVHRAMPNFISRMWMQDVNGAPVAAFYGPSSLNWRFKGKKIKIKEVTEYPFGETIDFKFACDVTVTMPFTFRIPSWCSEPSLKLNGEPVAIDLPSGEFITVDNSWRNGDVLTLELPMSVELKRDRQWQWLKRGPLVFAYDVPHTETRENDSPFAPRTFMPAGDWNYALDLDSDKLDRVKVVKTGTEGYPYDNPPLALEVPARRVTNFSTLDCNRYTPQVPVYFETAKEKETIRLVPFGATVTRVTAFPYPAKREMAPVTSVAVAGPFPYNRNIPLAEQIFEPEYWEDYSFMDKGTYLAPNADEYCDLIKQFHTSGNVMGYMMFRIWSDKAGRATLAVAAADGCLGWLNGKPVLEIEPIMEGECMEPLWFDVRLKQGYNFLKLKVCDWKAPDQYRDAWGAKVMVWR